MILRWSPGETIAKRVHVETGCPVWEEQSGTHRAIIESVTACLTLTSPVIPIPLLVLTQFSKWLS